MSIQFAEAQPQTELLVAPSQEKPTMLREREVDSELFGPIEMAQMLAVAAAVTSNDEVRHRYPAEVVNEATKKVREDVAHCIAVSSFAATQQSIQDPTRLAYSRGTETDQPEQANANRIVAAKSDEDDVEVTSERYYPDFDDDPDDDTTDPETLVAEAFDAEAREKQKREADMIQLQKEINDLEAVRLVSYYELKGREVHLGRRERAFVIDAVEGFDPALEKRRLAAGLFRQPDIIQPPAVSVPSSEHLVGYHTLRDKVAVSAGRAVARTVATLRHTIGH
jgi:hypothetical protein